MQLHLHGDPSQRCETCSHRGHGRAPGPTAIPGSGAGSGSAAPGQGGREDGCAARCRLHFRGFGVERCKRPPAAAVRCPSIPTGWSLGTISRATAPCGSCPPLAHEHPTTWVPPCLLEGSDPPALPCWTSGPKEAACVTAAGRLSCCQSLIPLDSSVLGPATHTSPRQPCLASSSSLLPRAPAPVPRFVVEVSVAPLGSPGEGKREEASACRREPSS